jgi:ketosteroid isomerase-like protein
MRDLLADDVTWMAVEPAPWDCHSREDVLRVLRQHFDEGVRYRLVDLRVLGGKALLHLAASIVTETGQREDWTVWQVVTFDGDRIVSIRDCADGADAEQALFG